MARPNAKDVTAVSKKRPRESGKDEIENDVVPPKPKRQYSQQDQKLADLYEKLADQSHQIRLDAAKQLLQELSSDYNLSAEVTEKVLTRLFRGLSSGRKAARYGYFVALTELLQQIYRHESKCIIDGLISVDQLIQLMVQVTKADRQAVGQEKRDHQFGRLYGSKALIQSSVLFQTEKAQENWNKLLDIVFELAISVPWLREECGLVIVDAIESIASMDSPNSFVEACLEKLDSNRLLKTPEGVAVWLKVQSTFPNFSGYPSSCWAQNEPLDANNRADLRKAMRDQYTGGQDGDESRKVKSGVWQQTIHFAWEMVMNRAIELSKPDEKPRSKQDEPNKFKSIWKGLVDDGLFLETSSVERKSWGFQLFSKMLKSVADWALPCLLQPKVVQNLITSQSTVHMLLYEAGLDSLKKLKARATAKPGLAHSIVIGLISKDGTAFFDRMTKTKTTEELMISASSSSFSIIVESFGNFIYHQTHKDEDDAEKGRQALADLLLHAVQGRVKAGLIASESKGWIKKLLALLVNYAFCKPRAGATSEVAEPEISNASRTMFRARLSSCLASIMATSTDNACYWPWYALHHLHSITKSSKPHELVLEADKQVLQVLKTSYNIVKYMQKMPQSESANSITQQIVLLYSMSLLEAYGGATDAVSILSELNDSFGSHGDAKSEPRYDQILEILLSFLSKSSHLHRNMTTSIFTATTSQITSEGLDSLSTILVQPETWSGQQELFAEENDDEVGSDGFDSDVELIDPATITIESSEDSGEETDEAGDESELDEEVEDFEKKLAQALKTSQPSAKGIEDMTDDESMDDEEMLAIEPKLAAVFRQRRLKVSKQKEKKETKENIVAFKKRVLDLISIYFKQEYANPLSLQLLLPLLELIRISGDASLQQKAKVMLDNLTSMCTKNKTQPVFEDAESGWKILQGIHEEVGKKVQDKKKKLHSAACSKASLHLIKCLVTKDNGSYVRAIQCYSATQNAWFAGKSGSMQATFFTDWINWSNNCRK